jgi:methylase of polypeptide subunit release factors
MYERLFVQIASSIEPLGYRTIRLLIEFGFDQREIAEKVIASYGWEYEFFSDYAGVERFCEIELRK